MSWALLSTGKSGKREVATSLLLFWAYITGYLFFWVPESVFKDYEEGWSTLTWATFAFAAGAFGIDFVMKQGGFSSVKAPPQRRAHDRQPQDMGPP